MARPKQTARKSTTKAALPEATNNMAATDHDNEPKSSPTKTMLTVDKRWVSQDLDLLRSGLFADAEIICFMGNWKVHRNILAARSAYFKKAFSSGYTVRNLVICFTFLTDASLTKEERDGKVFLGETAAWQVNLILYFFYSGGIDMSDKALTEGRNKMSIGIELLRLGTTFESESMQDYGRDLLVSYLGGLLHYLCDTSTTEKEMDARFQEQKNIPSHLCMAVRNAYNAAQPVITAQPILADFAFAARIHLFKNKEFVAFIESKEIPEFGNLVLRAQMNGGVSGAFNGNRTFKKWQDWRITPPSAPEACSEWLS